MFALSPRAAAWLRQHLPAPARAHVFALAGPGFVAVEDWPPRQPPSTTLMRCLALAMLVHLLIVVAIGSAPPGTASPGQGVWGAINITLRGALPGAGPSTAAPPQPEAYSGPTGTATERRWGGAVRAPEAAPAEAEPGAARLGTWNAQPTPREADLEAPLQRAPAPVLQAEEPRSVPGVPEALAPIAPPSAEGSLAPLPALQDRARPMLEGSTRPPDLPPKLDALPTQELTPIAPLPRALPSLPPAPTRADAVPPTRRTEPLQWPALGPAPPAETLKPLPPLPEPKALPSLPVAPSRSSQALPRDDAALAAPRLAETAPTPAVPAPLQPEPKQMQPLEARPATVASPAPAIERVPRIEAPALPSMPAMTPMPAPVPATPATAQTRAEPSATERPSNAGSSLPTMAAPAEVGVGVPRPAAGAPDAGARTGRDVATPAAEAASAPKLNLELARPRGGELSSQGSRSVLQLMPRPPEVKSKLATDIEKAGKADCRTAHGGAGLLAVGPLVADALSGKGCKW